MSCCGLWCAKVVHLIDPRLNRGERFLEAASLLCLRLLCLRVDVGSHRRPLGSGERELSGRSGRDLSGANRRGDLFFGGGLGWVVVSWVVVNDHFLVCVALVLKVF